MNSDFDNYILDGIDENGNIQEEVFSLLFNTFYQSYINFITSYTHSVEDSADIVNSFFLKVPEVLYKLKLKNSSYNSISDWLFICFRNYAFNMLTRTPKQQCQEINKVDEFEYLSENIDTHDLLLLKVDMEYVLSETELLLIQLKYFKGFTVDKISKMTNIPNITVRRTIDLAVRKLKKLYSRKV